MFEEESRQSGIGKLVLINENESRPNLIPIRKEKNFPFRGSQVKNEDLIESEDSPRALELFEPP